MIGHPSHIANLQGYQQKSLKRFYIRRLDTAVNDRIGFYPLYLEDRECGEQGKEGFSQLKDFRKTVALSHREWTPQPRLRFAIEDLFPLLQACRLS